MSGMIAFPDTKPIIFKNIITMQGGRKMKKSSKKVLGYILSISIAATAIFPIQGIAAEQRKDTATQIRQKESSE